MGYQFHRQVPIDRFIVDFYCHELMLAIEVDGKIHDKPSQRKSDITRQETLEALGVRFFRFRAKDVEENCVAILNELQRKINQIKPINGEA